MRKNNKRIHETGSAFPSSQEAAEQAIRLSREDGVAWDGFTPAEDLQGDAIEEISATEEPEDAVPACRNCGK
jgi:hypothetical protein